MPAQNGIIHNCTHGNNPDVKLTEDEMIVRIFTYLDKLFHIVKPQASVQPDSPSRRRANALPPAPTAPLHASAQALQAPVQKTLASLLGAAWRCSKSQAWLVRALHACSVATCASCLPPSQRLLFMAIDGSAPRAKMNQQRARRFKSGAPLARKQRRCFCSRSWFCALYTWPCWRTTGQPFAHICLRHPSQRARRRRRWRRRCVEGSLLLIRTRGSTPTASPLALVSALSAMRARASFAWHGPRKPGKATGKAPGCECLIAPFQPARPAWRMLTPPAAFMARLGAHIRFFIRKKIAEDTAWQKPTIIFSGGR